ncbi:hypothetical protein B296_00014800 [Ensete ventricosum]|uniref:Transposase (putative) gypsy type domain-containing protein n=1 Tax=Ensete ventricosum TaxID=4639 RepID=A0A427AUM1_ENSVE|nr:hypothetical protein B296_00014800 [Ensete ventricosum]
MFVHVIWKLVDSDVIDPVSREPHLGSIPLVGLVGCLPGRGDWRAYPAIVCQAELVGCQAEPTGCYAKFGWLSSRAGQLSGRAGRLSAPTKIAYLALLLASHGGFSISVDALEVGLRFPLRPVIGDCLSWWQVSSSQIEPNSWRYLITFLGECRESGIVSTHMVNMNLLRSLLKVGGGHFGSVASIAATPSPTVVPVAVDTAPAYSPFEVHEIPPEQAIRKVLEFSGKHPAEASPGRRKKRKIYGRHKSRRRD